MSWVEIITDRKLNESIERLNLIVPAPSRQRRLIDIAGRTEPYPPGRAPTWLAFAEARKPVIRLDGRMPARRRRGSFG